MAAARGLYQPMILSVGAAFAFLNDKAGIKDFDLNEWMADNQLLRDQ